MKVLIKMDNDGEENQIDFLKVILACLVILRHCGQNFFSPVDIFMKLMNILSPIAVPTFFMISGYLFFYKNRSCKDLRKYLWRILKFDYSETL